MSSWTPRILIDLRLLFSGQQTGAKILWWIARWLVGVELFWVGQ
jgi:hypothetical protein